MLQNVYTHAVSSSVSKRLEKERGGKGDSKTTMRKRRGWGGVHGSQRGMGMEGKRLTGAARTQHPNQLESLISPSNNTITLHF